MTEKEKVEILEKIKRISDEIVESNDRQHVIDISLDAYNLVFKLPQEGGHANFFETTIRDIKDNWDHLKNDNIDENTFIKYRNRMCTDIHGLVTAFKMYYKPNKTL
jgi:hypothetical protein